jgi:uncharacterized RDD family membrane protein YckC
MIKVGIGTRVLNFLVDTFLLFWLAYAAYKVGYFYAFYYKAYYFPFYYYFFAMQFLYYFVFESMFLRTPGKWLTLSRVVTNGGKKPSLGQIFIRSLFRVLPIDCFFLPFLEKTLHDAVSKTEVVEV